MRLLPHRMTVKRALKRGAGLVSTWMRPLVAPPAHPHVSILMYHRVASVDVVDPELDNWNVPPRDFDRQIGWLAAEAEIVPLAEVPARLAQSGPPPAKPLVCLTFDDGFANFHGEVLPILRRHGACATLFVVTKYVGSSAPMPFDRWSLRHASRLPEVCWRAISWPEIEACVASGRVTIGSHSHEHRIGSACTADELRVEAERSRAVLRERLGEAHASCYSYPYGSTRPALVTPDYVAAVRHAGFSIAVSTDLALADSRSDRWFLPRIEVCGLDSPAVLRAKVVGALAPYAIPQWLRTARRSA